MGEVVPMIGAQRVHKGQVYKLVERRPYTRRDGTETVLTVWQSGCAECGAPFKVTTPALSRKFEPSRRCQRHKRPGQRVKATGGGNERTSSGR